MEEKNLIEVLSPTDLFTKQEINYLNSLQEIYQKNISELSELEYKKELERLAIDLCWKSSPGLLHHSDRGSQYACHDYRKRLIQYGMVASMSRKGNCWDNAPTERFFRSLKSERLSHCRFVTRQSAEIQILDYISYYNSMRLHSTLGYQTPLAYEKEHCRMAA